MKLEISPEWCLAAARREGDAEIGAGALARDPMLLFSVCIPCNVMQPYDGTRRWGDFDKCPKCGATMDVHTEAGIRNENARRHFAGTPPLLAKDAS